MYHDYFFGIYVSGDAYVMGLLYRDVFIGVSLTLFMYRVYIFGI